MMYHVIMKTHSGGVMMVELNQLQQLVTIY